MAKVLKSAVSTIFLLVLLVNLYAISPPVNAVQTLHSNIDIIWGNNIAKPVIPRDELRQLNLTVNYKVDWGRDFAYGALKTYQNKLVLVDLQVTEFSPWCIATLSVTTLLIPISWGVTNSSVALNVQLKENAPAFGGGYVKILAKTRTQGVIEGFEKVFTLEFTPGYLPRINVNLPEGTAKNINPAESAIFPIEINNLGNARTTVFLTVEDIPDGWTAVVDNDITLEENGQSSATLTVKPPRDFGFHDDRKAIMVKLTPARVENITELGKPSYVTVVVQSRGFFTPGFEAITFIGAIAVVLLCFSLLRKRKK
jgi:hypothetical protein